MKNGTVTGMVAGATQQMGFFAKHETFAHKALNRGVHTGVFTGYTQDKSKATEKNPDGSDYLLMTILVDGETHPRKKTIYAGEYQFMIPQLGEQLDIHEKGQALLDKIIADKTAFKFWIVENPNPGYADNWQYAEPVVRDIVTEEDGNQQTMDI